MKRDFLSLIDYSKEEIMEIIDLALKIKRDGFPKDLPLKDKYIVLLFQKPSTRTRASFEVAINKLGGKSFSYEWSQLQTSRGETISDTAKVLSAYFDAIVARVYEHEILIELAKYSSIPVINALSNLLHPCQALADAMTILETKGKLSGLKLSYIGDGNNVCNSLLIMASKFGMNISVACPKGYEPNPLILEIAKKEALKTGSMIEILREPEEAIHEADIVYTDTFISMGEEKEANKKLSIFLPKYQVNMELFKKSKKDSIFMHCLPAHREQEVTSDVIDSERSVVFIQAENRLYTEAALLIKLFHKLIKK